MLNRLHLVTVAMAAAVSLCAQGQAQEHPAPPGELPQGAATSVAPDEGEPPFDETWVRVVASAMSAIGGLTLLESVAFATTLTVELQGDQASPPPQAVRTRPDALQQGELRPSPLAVKSTPSTISDARQQHAVLLGVELTLPWQIP